MSSCHPAVETAVRCRLCPWRLATDSATKQTVYAVEWGSDTTGSGCQTITVCGL